MQFQSIIPLCCLLLLSIACNDDVARNRKNRKPMERQTQGQNAQVTAALFSTMHRDRGVAPLTHAEEILQTLNNKLPAAYRLIPDMEKDDEGRDGSTIISQSRIGRPQVNCGSGLAFAGIQERIQDCLSKNPGKSLWDGSSFASSGEGQWQLVSLNQSVEIWQDVRTGLVWSEILSAGNWCQAAGNDQQPNDLVSVNCHLLMEGKSICTDYTADGMGDISWRLPTRNDYLQADINGARFVLKKNSSTALWTATLQSSSAGRRHAWAYYPGQGTLAAHELSASKQVRCVGAARK
jgi:hypothetical protein